MKKLVFLALIALLAIGAVSAQGWAPPTPPETVRLEGTLQLQNGRIVLSTGTAVYFVPGLPRLVGFIDGLREGARITVEGYAFGNILRSTKLSVGGREYDLIGDAPARGAGQRWGGGPGWNRAACPKWGADPRGGHHWGGGPRGGVPRDRL